MAQAAELFWRDAAEAPTEPAGAAGYGEPVPPSVRAITHCVDDDEPEPSWCLDDGSAMTVMTTSAIRSAVARGELNAQLKVWRDGMPYWLELHEVIELTPPATAVAAHDDHPESHIRRRHPRHSDHRDTLPGLAPTHPLKSMAILLFILFAGVVVGFVLTAVAVGDPLPIPRLSAVTGSVAQRCRAAVSQARDRRTASAVVHRRWLHGSAP